MNTPLNGIAYSERWMRFFHEITECGSYIVIGFKIDKAMHDRQVGEVTGEINKLMKAYQAGEIDLVHAQAYEILGDYSQAKKLRDFVANRKGPSWREQLRNQEP